MDRKKNLPTHLKNLKKRRSLVASLPSFVVAFMALPKLGVINGGDMLFFVLSLFLVLAGLIAYFCYTFFSLYTRKEVSPYSGMPLRYATELTFALRNQVIGYLRSLQDYDNRAFDMERAGFCRDTGRLFPDCVTFTGGLKLDWGFIRKRYKGHFVSYGSLTPEKRKEILEAHGSLEGFQTAIVSQNPSPRLVEEACALAKPGPLYVDPESKILLGWRVVPGTEIEVLIVQKPRVVKIVTLPKAKS